MAVSIADLVVTVGADIAGGLKGLDTIEARLGDFKSLGDQVWKGVAVAGAAGAAALAAGMGVALKEAMDSEVNIAKLEAVIKSTGGAAGVTSQEVQAMADALSRVTRFSDDAILTGQTMLLTFTNIGEDVFPRATEAMLNMGEMFGGVDQAAVQLGKALNDPVQGVTALRRVGVQLTEAQEEQIRKFMEVGDVASAQTIILNELETEFGGVARAAGDTFAGKLTILKNQLLNVAEGIGMQLLPALSKFVDKVLMPAIPKVEQVAGAFATFIQAMVDGPTLWAEASDALGFLLGNTDRANAIARNTVQTFWKLVEVVKAFVQDAVAPFVTQHAQAFIGALKAIGIVLAGAAIVSGVMALVGAITALVNPINLVIAAIALLGAAWQSNFMGFGDFMDGLLSRLVGLAGEIKSAFEEGGLEEVGRLLWDKIKGGVTAVKEWVQEKIIDPIVAKFNETDWGEVSNKLTELLGQAIGVAGSALASIGDWVNDELISPVVDYLSSVNWSAVGNRLLDLLEQFLGFAGAGIAGIGVWLWETIIQPLGSYLSNVNWAHVANRLLEVLEKMLGFAAAGLAGIGVWLWDNIIQPLGSYLSNVNWANVASRLLEVLEKLLGFAAAGIAGVGEWAYENIIQPIIDKFTDPATWTSLYNAAKNLGTQIVNAIIDMAQSLPGKLLGIVTGAIDSVTGALGGGGMGLQATLLPAGGGGTHERVRDRGGMGLPGVPYWIGTGAQPELFVPSSPGTFYPANALGGMTIDTVNVYGVQDVRQFYDELQQEARRRNVRLGARA